MRTILKIAVTFTIIGVCLRLYTLLLIVTTDNPQWWVSYLGTVSCGLGALGLFLATISIISPSYNKGSPLIIFHVTLLILPFLILNLFQGITAFNLIMKNF